MVSRISFMICVYMKEGSSWSRFFLAVSPPVPMMLMEMALCSHCWAACLSASQIGVISVKTPLIFDQSLAHCSWYVLITTEDEDGVHLGHVVHPRDNLLTKGTRDDHTSFFLLHILQELDTLFTIGEGIDGVYSTAKLSNGIATVAAVVVRCYHPTRRGEHSGPFEHWFDHLYLHLWDEQTIDPLSL